MVREIFIECKIDFAKHSQKTMHGIRKMLTWLTHLSNGLFVEQLGKPILIIKCSLEDDDSLIIGISRCEKFMILMKVIFSIISIHMTFLSLY